MNLQKPPFGIEWTRVYGRRGYTSNPIRGCEHQCQWIMPDGARVKCYAKSTALSMPKSYPGGFENLTFHPEVLEEWPKKKEPCGIFLDSMSDLFGAGVHPDWIMQTLEAVKASPQHIFFSLTKNPSRMEKFAPFPRNLWTGISAPPTFMFGRELSNHQRHTWFKNGLNSLVRCASAITWVSLEPLSIDLSDILQEFAAHIDWAVIGAGSNGAKKYQPDGAVFMATLRALPDTAIFFKGNIDRGLANNVAGRWREEYPTYELIPCAGALDANKPADSGTTQKVLSI